MHLKEAEEAVQKYRLFYDMSEYLLVKDCSVSLKWINLYLERKDLAFVQIQDETILQRLIRSITQNVCPMNFTVICKDKKGMFTRQRRPKLAAHYFKDRWHKIPDFGYDKKKT